MQIIYYPIIGWTTLLWSGYIPLAAAATDGSDFSNNLFTDLGPLLSLFGEKFTQQFLSQSFYWLDHIIFAMAPLGIITAIVGAIRVGGPPWLRALIGRARENRAAVEVELMSSTSHEVCELWNGQSVVRTLGRPMVRQLLYLEWDKEKEETFGLHTLETARNGGLIEKKEFQHLNPFAWVRRNFTSVQKRQPNGDFESQTSGEYGTPPRPDDAPNILLNLHRGSKICDLVFAATVGTIIQVCSLAYAIGVTYIEGIRLSLPNSDETTRWGCPILIIGTILLTAGLVVVCSVIEESTVEDRWMKAKAYETSNSVGTPNIHLLWVQKGHVVGDQTFDSFVLQPQEGREEVFTSRRLQHDETLSTALTHQQSENPRTKTRLRLAMDEEMQKLRGMRLPNQLILKARRLFAALRTDTDATRQASISNQFAPTRTIQRFIKSTMRSIGDTRLQLFTVIGTVIGLCGFILQFQGFRGVHWTCALVQLAGVALMTAVRAWIRRGLLILPHAESVVHDHEIDSLAKDIACQRMKLWSGQPNSPDQPYFGHSLSGYPGFFSSQRWTTGLAYPGSVVADGQLIPEDWQKNNWTGPGQRAVDIRCRIQALTAWPASVSKYARAAATAIKIVMDRLLISCDKLVWTLDIPLEGRLHKVRILIEREQDRIVNLYTGTAPPASEKPCKDVSDKVESVLSLWLFELRDRSKRTKDMYQIPGTSSRQQASFNMGPSETRSLLSDVYLWTGYDVSAYELEHERYHAYNQSNLPNEEFIIGWGGVQGETRHYSTTEASDDFWGPSPRDVCVPFSASLEHLLAQHLFSGFVFSAAKHMTFEDQAHPTTATAGSKVDVADQDTWRFCKIDNPQLNATIREVQLTGIGNSEESSLLIIPGLSYASKLPRDSIVDVMLQKAQDLTKDLQWSKARDAYYQMGFFIRFQNHFLSDRSFYRFIFETITYLLKAQKFSPSFNSRWGLHDQVWDDYPLRRGLSFEHMMRELQRLFTWQDRGEEFGQLWKEITRESPTIEERFSRTKQTELAQLFGCTSWDPEVVQKHLEQGDIDKYFSSADSFGWTPLHHAAVQQPEKVDYWADKSGVALGVETQDIYGRTPLHLRAKSTKPFQGRDFLSGSEKILDDNDMTPLHWAAQFGNHSMAAALSYRSPINAQNKRGATPLHLAATALRKSQNESQIRGDCQFSADSNPGDSSDPQSNNTPDEASDEASNDISDDMVSLSDREAVVPEEDYLKIIELLLSKAAQLDVVDSDGKTAREVAESAGNSMIAWRLAWAEAFDNYPELSCLTSDRFSYASLY